MSHDTTTTQPQACDEESGRVRWRCTKCGTAFGGTPRQRSLDARDRWRRDRCRSCGRATFMEREGASTPRAASVCEDLRLTQSVAS
jgi:DNA-directed RNA polymerase subunit RPC12/RpoP